MVKEGLSILQALGYWSQVFGHHGGDSLLPQIVGWTMH